MAGRYEKRIDVINETVNAAQNTSNITIALYFRRTDYSYWGYNREGSAWYRIAIEGTGYNTGNVTWTFDLNVGQNVWVEIGRKTFTDIPHDANGDLSFTMFGDMYFGTSVSPTAAELGGTGQIRNAYFGKHIDRNVKITQFEKNNSTSGTTVGFNWATSDNIDALHLYDGDTKLKEFSVSGKSGSITYTVTPNRNYRFQIRVKKTGTSLWTNSGYIEHSIGYPSITGDFNLNINSPINLYFTGTTPTSSVYLYVGSKDDDNYEALASGSMTAYDFMINKIYTLEIEPAQLALEPCSASAVITDVKTGDVLACVSYPGYDNNRLVNNMDTDYYAKLSTDKSSPFFNKATQQTAAPGSTFKILSTIAGMSEGVIDDGTYINCTGSFDLVTPPINCWNKQGHGEIEIREAIEQSCNYYFNMVGFKLGQDADGNFSENRSLSVLQKYASEIGLDKKTGIEITESAPHVSDSYAVPSYIGQGTNAYTTSQLARYATAIATSGNVYDLTLLDRQTDSKGNTLKKYEPDIINTVDVSQNVWDDIHDGMYRVVQTHRQFDGLGVDVAGKTGTAEVNVYHPNHGMFVGYAPASDPEYAIAVRIENGYTSGNACLAADDIFKYIFELTDEKSILTGVAASDTSDTSND